MNHIAFRRVGDVKADNKYNRQMMDQISGKVVELELPEHLTANGLLEAMNLLLSREEFDRL